MLRFALPSARKRLSDALRPATKEYSGPRLGARSRLENGPSHVFRKYRAVTLGWGSAIARMIVSRCGLHENAFPNQPS